MGFELIKIFKQADLPRSTTVLTAEAADVSTRAVVAPDWLACFAAGDRAALFDAYFESAPCAALLQTLVTCGALALSFPPGAPYQAQLQASLQAQMQLLRRESGGDVAAQLAAEVQQKARAVARSPHHLPEDNEQAHAPAQSA